MRMVSLGVGEPGQKSIPSPSSRHRGVCVRDACSALLCRCDSLMIDHGADGGDVIVNCSAVLFNTTR